MTKHQRQRLERIIERLDKLRGELVMIDETDDVKRGMECLRRALDCDAMRADGKNPALKREPRWDF